MMTHDQIIKTIMDARGVKKHCLRENNTNYCIYYYTHRAYPEFAADPGSAYARGVVVIEQGDERWLRLPFTKFFNVGESPYTKPDRLGKPNLVMEKIDGSLVVAWRDPMTGEIRVHSRKSLWDRSATARKFWEYVTREGLRNQLDGLLGDNVVAMFEYYDGIPQSAANKRRIDTGVEPGVYLLAVRDMRTLGLRPPREGEWPRLPRRWEPMELVELKRRIDRQDTSEGVVAWLDKIDYPAEWHMLDPLVKVKSLRYLTKLSGGGKTAIRLLLTGHVDDLIAAYPDMQEPALEAEEILRRLRENAEKLRTYRDDVLRMVRANSPVAKIASGTPVEEIIWKYAPKNLPRTVRYLRGLNQQVERLLERLEKTRMKI